MSEEETYTEAEPHRHFAVTLNGKVWELLEKPHRSRDDDEAMVHAAHASCFHWLQTGTQVHHQRAEWLIARVYCSLGIGESALRHAQRCLELTREHPDAMSDFDVAYAYEGMARANAVAGNKDEALKYLKLAEEAGQSIANDEDRKIFLGDFNSGNWNNLK